MDSPTICKQRTEPSKIFASFLKESSYEKFPDLEQRDEQVLLLPIWVLKLYEHTHAQSVY